MAGRADFFFLRSGNLWNCYCCKWRDSFRVIFFLLILPHCKVISLQPLINGKKNTALWRQTKDMISNLGFPSFFMKRAYLKYLSEGGREDKSINFYKASYCTVLNMLQFSSDKVCVYNFSSSLIMSIKVNHLRSLLEDCMEYMPDTK